jgi:hypothetical protein
MSGIADLLNNQIVQGILVAGAGWLLNKLHVTSKASTLTKVGAAIATSSDLMLQFVLTEPSSKTPEEMLRAFKGIVAIQFAKTGISDAAMAAAQPLIDKAIAAAVTKWVELHPAPHDLTMPITKKLGFGA